MISGVKRWAIAFNTELDGETYRPENRQQSDLPFSEDEREQIKYENYYVVGLNAVEFDIPPEAQIYNPEEECRVSRRIDGERRTLPAGVPCRNGAVQVSRWATQAAILRGDS
jgi:hypothetical protein